MCELELVISRRALLDQCCALTLRLSAPLPGCRSRPGARPVPATSAGTRPKAGPRLTWWMGEIDRYSVVVHCYQGAVVADCKRLHGVTSSSYMAEGSAKRELYKRVMYVRNIRRAFGHGELPPTILLSDNSSNVAVSNGSGSVSHSKHELCRFLLLQQAVRAGEVLNKHVDDEDNWADFLTKWVSAQKVNRSAAFLTNSRNRVPEGAHVPAG